VPKWARCSGNCSLSVTPPKSRKYGLHVKYETVRDRLDRLKETDLQGFSPLLAAIILITGEATDSFVENGLVTQDRFSMLPSIRWHRSSIILVYGA